MEGFVGRADELEAIADLIATARRERRVGALVLMGDPGIGKSRLLDEAERRAAPARILRFSGYEPESSVPLAAASPLLRRLAGASDDRTFHGLLDPDAEVGGLDEIRVFESVHRQLARLGPAVLFVDDLQWVDALSIALCHFLVRAAVGSGRGMALVVASRPSPVTDLFAVSLSTAIGDGALPAVVHLEPLDPDDGVRFVESRMGIVDRRDAIALWQKAGGSPFWLDLLAQAETGQGTVAEIVTARTRGLGADPNTLLGTLAILGRPVDALELESMLGWPSARRDGAASNLVDRGLAIDDGGVTRLGHDLIRDAVISHLPDATRRRLHARIASALERQSAGEVPVILAALEHRVASGSVDPDLALRILRSPQRRLVGGDGVRRVVELARDIDDQAVRGMVDEAAAILAAELGDQRLALDLWSAIARATGNRTAGARAELGASLAAYHLGLGDQARRWLDACRAKATDAPELAIAAEALDARILLWLEHRTEAGRAMAMRAVERGRRAIGSAAMRETGTRVRAAHVDALVAAWEAAIQAEDVEAILALADESLEASRELGLREILAARAMVGMALEYGSHQQRAADAYRQVWDEAWRAVLPVEAVDAGYRLAAILFDGLQLQEARRIASEAERLAARTGDQGRVRDRTRLVKYQLATVTGDWRAAIAAILAAAENEPDAHYRLVHHQLVAVWHARLGTGQDEALDHMRVARSLAASAGCPGCSRDVEAAAAEVFARFGRRAEALEALANWDSAGRRSYVESEWLRRRAGVLLAPAASGDVDPLPALTALRDEADGLGLAFHALWTEIDLGRFLATTDPAGAAAAFRRAAARAEAAGARTVRRLADQGLRTLGERPWRRGPTASPASGMGALSGREREVADLVALGATNAEIATRLFLSRKTIEHHVSNALAKLGLHSRAELAAHVGRAGQPPAKPDGAPPP
jgi:DNA-binding CsgD family transcriptional regulator